MKRILIVLLTLACAQVTFATDISGALSGILGPGTYHVVEVIYVNADDSLLIMPGTTFHFDGPYPFYIFGKLTAQGTENDSIIFTSAREPSANRWKGLRFEDSGSSGSALACCLIENGFATGASPNDRGGGVYCEYSSPTFDNCTFSDDSASYGGGVYCYFSSPTFTNCIFHNNSADIEGGGMYCYRSSPTFTNCNINNSLAYQGGGIYCDGHNCSPVFSNCIIVNNGANLGGGVNCKNLSDPSFTNCTFSGNFTEYYGGAVSCFSSSSPSLMNCILWNDSPREIDESSSTCLVTYSNIQGGWSGTGNVDEDPLFVSGPEGLYYLSQLIAGQLEQSPCANAGDPSSPVIDGTTRMDGVQDTWPVDMGYHYEISSLPPTNRGFVTLIHPGPSDWGYRLHWVSGSLSRLVFSNFCDGTVGSIGGSAQVAGWTATNYSDSIVFTTSTPLTSGTIDTFWLSHPYCSDVVDWTVGDSSGSVDGPLPVEMTTFQAFAGDGQVTLRWQTASELNNSHFVLYKRRAGQETFQVLTQIPGYGTTAEPHDYEFIDRWVQNSTTYEYRISDVDLAGHETFHEQIVTATPDRNATPFEFALYPNWPNPFNPTTTIRYDVEAAGLVSLKIFDLLGREVTTLTHEEHSAGVYSVTWDAAGMPSGVYLCRMDAEGFVQTRKMVLVK